MIGITAQKNQFLVNTACSWSGGPAGSNSVRTNSRESCEGEVQEYHEHQCEHHVVGQQPGEPEGPPGQCGEVARQPERAEARQPGSAKRAGASAAAQECARAKPKTTP